MFSWGRWGVLPFPALNDGPQTDIVGGGPLGLAAGQVTDDTHMAICLASSLAARGTFDAEDVARRYVAWMYAAFDVGRQTRAALSLVEKGTAALEAGYAVWESARRQPAGNGSLMRTVPIAVCFAADADARRRAALADSAITHADPRCRIACAVFDAAVAHAIAAGDATPRSMRSAAVAELPRAAAGIEERTPQGLVDAAVSGLAEDLDAAARDDPGMDEREVHYYRHAGYVRVALRLAFWELLHAPTFEGALLDVANRGGDADTNAAIAGALYGALVGEDAIPRTWREKVLGACTGSAWAGKVWGDAYHPRRLFEVMGRSPA
jgi:ADP-ribosylglycohydrolase